MQMGVVSTKVGVAEKFCMRFARINIMEPPLLEILDPPLSVGVILGPWFSHLPFAHLLTTLQTQEMSKGVSSSILNFQSQSLVPLQTCLTSYTNRSDLGIIRFWCR